MEYETDLYEGDYWAGTLVITDKITGKCGTVQLMDSRNRNVTLSQWRSSIKSHGLERAFHTWSKLVNHWH